MKQCHLEQQVDLDIITLKKQDFERQMLYHLYVESKKQRVTQMNLYTTQK